jgi:Trypsin-like peptidase domain
MADRLVQLLRVNVGLNDAAPWSTSDKSMGRQRLTHIKCQTKLCTVNARGHIVIARFQMLRFISAIFFLFCVAVMSSAAADTNQVANISGSFMQEHRGDIVIIKGNDAAGSGFIYTRGGRRFLVSNVHVLAAIKAPTFTPLDGSTLRFKAGPAFIAVGHDIIMLELEPGSNGIPLVESFEQTVMVNDSIVVYGNTGGGDVANAISGKLTGIGPNRIEIDAAIEHGNSGSPIIQERSGKVIGIATYSTEEDLLSGEKKVRRFGYRLDTVKQWETVDWSRFYMEADEMDTIAATTEELQQAFKELNGLNQRANKVRVYAYDSPAIRTALDDFYSALNQAKNQRAVTRADNNLLDSLNNISRDYGSSSKPTFTYEYFRQEFADQDADRTETMNSLVSIIQK